MACPSGSRSVTAFRNPALPSGSSTAPVETKADRLLRRVCVASSTLIPKNLVCQWMRSFDRSSGGNGRPSQQENPFAGRRQLASERPAAGAGADHDHVVVPFIVH